MTVYTDGATSNNGKEGAAGGWAYVIIDEYRNTVVLENSGHIEDATNNICELTALIKACECVTGFWGAHLIFSDSAYCINCYKEKWYEKWERNGWKTSNGTPVANQELWRKLIPYFNCNTLKFEKIKGHAGNFWNDYVDKKAVEAKRGIDG